MRQLDSMRERKVGRKHEEQRAKSKEPRATLLALAVRPWPFALRTWLFSRRPLSSVHSWWAMKLDDCSVALTCHLLE